MGTVLITHKMTKLTPCADQSLHLKIKKILHLRTVRVISPFTSNSSWQKKLSNSIIFQILLTSSKRISETQTQDAYTQGSHD